MVNIVVDSGCDYNSDILEKNGMDFSLVPLSIQLGDKNFIDDENLNINLFWKDLENCTGVPRTAAPPPEKFIEKIKKDGSTFIITLSSHLSGSYNSAMLAKRLYQEEIENKFIHVFDSLSASMGETVIALKIVECAKKKLPDIEIVNSVDNFIKKMRTYFILDNYDNLVKNGRMNPYVAKAASFLGIKVICAGVEGNIKFMDKARGFGKAVVKLVDRMSLDEDLENRTLGIMHVSCLDKALMVKDEVMKRLKFKEIYVSEARGLSSVYANIHGIVLAY